VKLRHWTILAAVCFATACKAKGEPTVCHTYLGPGGALSPEDLAQLERLTDGGDPCPALGKPTLEVGSRGAVLDGNVVVPWADLPVGQGRRVDVLFEDMKADRTLWKMLHPGRPFGPVLEVSVAPEVDVVPAVSALNSASLAGYTNVRIHDAKGELRAFYARPLLGGTDTYPMVLRVTVRKDGQLDAGFERLRAPGMPRNLPTPPPPAGPLPDGVAVAAFVDGACAEAARGCVNVLAVRAESGKFDRLVAVAREVLGARTLIASEPMLTFEVAGQYLEQPPVDE